MWRSNARSCVVLLRLVSKRRGRPSPPRQAARTSLRRRTPRARMGAAMRLQHVRPRRLATTCGTAPPPRLFCASLPASGRLSLSGEESRHATRVLRLREGDSVEVFDGDGALASARIVLVDARSGSADVELCGPAVRSKWTGPRWDVAVACVGMSQRADWLVEKLSELGAHAFIPLLTERAGASKHRRGEQASERQRWERLSVAASKQSLRLHSLKVAPTTALSELLAVPAPLALVALQGGAPLRDVLAAQADAVRTNGGLLIVGPPVRARLGRGCTSGAVVSQRLCLTMCCTTTPPGRFHGR